MAVLFSGAFSRAQQTVTSVQQTQANQLFINPLPFTSRVVRSYNMACTNTNQIHFTLNGSPFSYTPGFFGFGFYDIEFPFGSIKPGDVLTITDDCGSTPFPRTVTDDLVYVEVPNGASYTGNGIGPTDQSPPYDRLVTPVKVGKCEPVSLNAHVLCPVYLFNQATDTPTGAFLINGSPIKAPDFDISFNGQQNITYTVGANGSISTTGNLRMESLTQYSGSNTVTLEYRHNGSVIGGDFVMAIGGVRFRRVRNNQVTIEKSTYTNDFQERTLTGNYTNSVFKITYDQAYYRMYIDNVLVDEHKRFVVYSAEGGSLSTTNPLDYRTGVTYTPATSGTHWVTAVVDGVRFVQQKFEIADDMVLNETVINVACNGGNTGRITANVTGGQPPLSYSINNGAFGSSNVFSDLTANSYLIKVRDRSGCEISKTVSVSQGGALTLAVTNATPVQCAGGSNGSVTLSAGGSAGPYTYSNDGSFYGSSATFPNLSEGSYTFYAKDGNGCVKTVSQTIGYQSKITVSLKSQQNISCFGGNNGTITIDTVGSSPSGILQFSTDGSTFQTNPQFSSLSAGAYQIRVKDNLCQTTVNVTLTQPADLSVSASVAQNVSCFEGANGQIQANVTGGVPTYQYSLDGTTYGNSALFSSLSANNYKIWVKDVNGCVKQSGIVTIVQPTVLVPGVVSTTHVKCFGGNDGEVGLSASGGTSPYEYSKNGSDFQTAATLTGLSAGVDQTFTIRDSKGCTKTVTATLTQPAAAFTISLTRKTDLTCFQDSTGRIEVSAAGGTTAYRFSLNNTSFQTSGVFTTLAAGSYTVYGKDAQECAFTLSVTVNQPAVLQANVTVTDNLCFNDQTGKFIGAGSGGTTPYLYSRDGTNYQSGAEFGRLSAGNYTLYVKDAHQCTASKATVVVQPPVLTASAAITRQVSCFSGSDAEAVVTAGGGTLPYTYTKDGSVYQSGATFTGLAATAYTLQVKDANGCTQNTNLITPTQPPVLVPDIAGIVNVRCFNGSDGSVQLAASGGTAPYLFSKDGSSFQTTVDFSGLAAAAYTFTVKDGKNCLKTIAATVTHPALFTLVQQSKQDLSCYGNNSGRIQLTGSGGTAPYQYSDNNTDFRPSGQFTDLAAQNYTFYAKDAQNCPAQLGVSFSQPTDIQVTLLSKKDIDCDYYTRGAFQVTASGSHGNFTYGLSGTDLTQNPVQGTSNATGVFAQLKAGNYTITARDGTGCTKDFPVTLVPKNSPIRFDVSKNLPSSCMAGDGTVTITSVNGGRQPYQYRISTQNVFSPVPVFGNLTNGTYYVTVADSLCAYTQPVDVSLPGSLKATYTISPISCAVPNANLSIDQTTGGNGNYSYALDGTNFSANRQFSNLVPNLYAVTIRDSPLSCRSVVSVEIKEQNRADLKLSDRRDVSCFGGNNGYLKALGDNNTGPFTFALNGGAFGQSPEFQFLSVGTYKITARNRLGCIDSIQAVITQPTALTGGFTTKTNDCFGDRTGRITASSGGGTSPYQYSIDGTNYQSSVEFSGISAGNYILRIRDAQSCLLTQAVEVRQPALVEPAPEVLRHVQCFGGNDGLVRLNVQGGILPYQYSTNGTSYINENEFANLTAGTYPYWVKDANGCTKTTSVIVTQPPNLIPKVVGIEAVKCFAGSDGAVELGADGGTLPYQYSKDQVNYQAFPRVAGLKEGIDQLFYVRDAHNCLKTITATVTQPAKPVSVTVAGKKDLLCFEDNTGQIELSAGGGTPPYRYSLDSNSYQSENIFQRLAAGAYRLHIRDANQCPFALNTLLTQPNWLTGTLTPKPNDCFGDRTGRINAAAQGGTLPYEYALDAGAFQGPEVFDDLTAGTYSVRIKDAHACTVALKTEVIQPTLVTLRPVYADTVRCFGESNGSVRIEATGGTPGYTYSKDGTRYLNEDLFKNLPAGDYRFWVKDANQCLHQTQLTVTQPEELQLSLTERTDPLCAGDENGRIAVAAAGGNGRYVFTLDNAFSRTAGLFEGLTQADYTLRATDRKGCFDTLTSVRLVWPKPLSAELTHTVPKCTGDANGALQLRTDGGTAPFRVTLNSLTPVSTNSLTEFTDLRAGMYALSVADRNGCRLRMQAEIPAPQSLNPISLGDSAVVCKEQAVRLNANNPGRTVAWFLDGKQFSTAQTVEVTAPGLYRVTAANATGCQTEGVFKLINNANALKADFLMPVQAFAGDTVYALNVSSPAPDLVKWDYPAEAYAIEKNLKRGAFVLTKNGRYTIKMTAVKGECINQKEREIELFYRKDTDQTNDDLGYKDQQSIESVIVYPNPNYGAFRLDVKLRKVSDAEVTVTRLANASTVYTANGTGQQQYLFDIRLQNAPQDIYIITIRAGTAAYTQKILVQN